MAFDVCMYIARPTKQYRKSIKHFLRSGSFDPALLEGVIDTLVAGKHLDSKHFPHRLQGEFSDCFECHIKDDVLLMYRFDESRQILSLVDIGSHSDLFG